MRFNAKELTFIGQQQAQEFEKEGVLFMKEKKDGLFKKGEAFVQRLFRLRGNLLFYMKGKDVTSEVAGLFVLERCMVHLDSEDDHPFTFLLDFEGDEKTVQLAAGSEEDRDNWIEHLHIAGYECMQMQMQSLREQIAARTGRDPIEDPEPSSLPEFKSGSIFGTDEPFFEMCISCNDLGKEIDGREPDTYASLHYITPPNMQWVPHSHTEIFEKSCCPTYLTTLGFNKSDCVEQGTRIKLIIYSVKERMTNTQRQEFAVQRNPNISMTQVGCSVFTLADLFNAPGSRLKLTLYSTVQTEVGSVTVMGWHNDCATRPKSLTDSMAQDGPVLDIPSNEYLERLRGHKTRRLDQLKLLYANVITKSFRFPTNSGQQLGVLEYMGESKFTFTVPRQLLQLWIDEEKEYIATLQDLGQLFGNDGEACCELQDYSMATSSIYSKNSEYLASFPQGSPFKPSSQKANKELEFAPTNLHLQRMWVQNDYSQSSACYDIVTVGCFSAYAQKYKQGGLKRMLRQLNENIMNHQSQFSPEGDNMMETINGVQNDISRLRVKVTDLCECVCRCAVQGKGEELSAAMTTLSDKMRQLLSVCQHPHIEQGYTAFNKATDSQSNHSDEFLNPPMNTQSQNGTDSGGTESWKWSGTDYVRSPTQEPFELTRLNTEAALVCALSKVEDFLEGNSEATRWLDELSPLIIRLKRCIEVMCIRAKSSLTFLTLHICGPHVTLLHSLKYRRDVCFSQALTSALTGLYTKLRTSFTDESYLQQLVRVGALLEFESLLSCHGDEMGMLEDFAVAVADINHVTFKMAATEKVDDIHPQIEGIRPCYSVIIPVPKAVFGLLPKELQKGHAIKIVPVLFSIGINDQATLAERFGDISLQNEINRESLKVLNDYYLSYSERMDKTDYVLKNTQDLSVLMQNLSRNVEQKKSKNTEVLHLAAQICRKLKGVRYTSCKSAKDRTAMGVTLEQVQVLQTEHDLAAHVYKHALDSMRSEGVRRENSVKNAGVRKYAFNSIQLLSFPKLYRPPAGTFGNAQS